MKVRTLVAHAYVAVDPAKLHAAALEIPLPAERLRKALLRYADETGAPPP